MRRDARRRPTSARPACTAALALGGCRTLEVTRRRGSASGEGRRKGSEKSKKRSEKRSEGERERKEGGTKEIYGIEDSSNWGQGRYLPVIRGELTDLSVPCILVNPVFPSHFSPWGLKLKSHGTNRVGYRTSGFYLWSMNREGFSKGPELQSRTSTRVFGGTTSFGLPLKPLTFTKVPSDAGRPRKRVMSQGRLPDPTNQRTSSPDVWVTLSPRDETPGLYGVRFRQS